jgi:hypothetical protein
MRRTYSKQFKQGIYHPINPDKLIGASTATYRSSFELKFFKFCDLNPNIIKWGSESIAIPYISPIDRRLHHYYIDNIVIIKEGDKIGKYLVEIKPKNQTLPPTESKRKKHSTLLYEQIMFAKNTAKWSAARKFCEAKGYKFLILTEALAESAARADYAISIIGWLAFIILPIILFLLIGIGCIERTRILGFTPCKETFC